MQVLEQVFRDLLKLGQCEVDVAHQPQLAKVAQQLESRMFNRADHVHVWRAVVVCVDHDPPATERGKNRRHSRL
jgi:hypothetical protein